MTTSSENPEWVNVHSDTVVYEMKGDVVDVGTTNFRIGERQEDCKVVPTVIVEMDSGISKEIALERLRRIVAEIEKNGLPETTDAVPLTLATKLIDLQATVEALSDEFKKVPSDVAARLLSGLEENASEEDE